MTSISLTPNNQLIENFQQNVFRHVPLDKQKLSVLNDVIYTKEYPRKSFLLSAGDDWDKLFFIQKGLIRLFYIDAKGNEFNKAFFAEGQCIWPVVPHDRHKPVLFNVAALEKSLILECPFQDLYQTLKQEAYWEIFALPYAERLAEQKFLREHDFLLLSASERFEKFCSSFPDLAQRIPDYHFASFLGITHVSLSRIKSKMINP